MSSFFLFPLFRIQFNTFARSSPLCSGERRETGKNPSLSNDAIWSSISGLVPLLLTQSKAPSMSRARSSALPSFLGSIESNFRNSPVGSVRSSFVPLLRNQFKASSRSLDLCSGVRRDIGAIPTFLKPSRTTSSSGETLLFRIQSNALSISRARCSDVWPFFLGKSVSILRKSPVGSFLSSSFPLLRNQLKASSRSFARCSGVRREIGTESSLSKEGSGSSSSSPTFLLLTQSRAASIWRARWSVFWPPSVGKVESNLRKSPVGSGESTSLPLLRIQFKLSSRSFPLCSGVRREMGTNPFFTKAGRFLSFGEIPLFRIQSNAPSISRARSSGD